MTVRLRGHHLLCLHGFRGLGYSPEFVANMQRIQGLLLDAPQTRVEVLVSPDDVCAACPHLSDSECGKSPGNRIREKDAVVLKRLSLIEGDTVAAGELFYRVAEEFSGGIEDVCSSCSWFDSGWCDEGIRSRAMSLGDS